MRFGGRSRAAALACMLLLAACTAPEETPAPEDAAQETAEEVLEEEPVEAPAPPAEYTAAELSALYGPSVWRVDVESCSYGEGGGTGFSIGGGLLVTSGHVVEDVASITVSGRSGGQSMTAELVGVADGVDLAVLRVGGDAGPALQWAEPDLLEEGTPVVSLSYPAPLRVFSVSEGLVNALVRSDDGLITSVVSDELTDYGSSGGPLLDARGHVVGIITEFLGGGVPVGVSLTYDALSDELTAIVAGERSREIGCIGPSQDEVLRQLRVLCGLESFWACDELYLRAEYGSDDERFGADCGGAAPGTDQYCVDLFGGTADLLGEDPYLDALVEDCLSDADGWQGDCDLLIEITPFDSEYEAVGLTCGGRREESWLLCAADFS